MRTGYNAMDGHISQIPGLSPTIGAVSLERTRGRRAGVLESDSDYVKLAKQGGHKGTAAPDVLQRHLSFWLVKTLSFMHSFIV